MKKQPVIFLLLIMPFCFCQAQIRIASANIDNWVKSNLSGQGVVVGNISHRGNPVSQGTFSSSGNVLQLQKGLVLSSGNVFNIAGFNSSYNLSASLGDSNEPETDPDLSKLLKDKMYDISTVEFDFVPMANSIRFNYQFGSDEYPEYVGSAFNDIFAFFISDENSTRNIALVPEKTIPVSINTVNSKTNANYFIDNNPFTQVIIKRQPPPKEKVERSFFGGIWHGIKSFFGSADEEEADRVEIMPDQALVKSLNPQLYRNLQYDGITKSLAAQAYVEPYKKYHLKMIIADVSDNIYDSGVFIEDHSLTAKRDTLQPGFVDYPDLAGKFDPRLILAGKTIKEIMPDNFPDKPAPVAAVPTATAPPRDNVMVPLQNVTIYFDFDKAELTAPEREKIRSAVAAYKQSRGAYDVYLTGHTDNKGSLNYNYGLSKRRNQAVTDALKQFDVVLMPSVIREKAYLQPAAENTSDEGRSRNRRVEIIFRKK